jgi:hypothetical protein
VVYLSRPIYSSYPNLRSSLSANTLFASKHGEERAIWLAGEVSSLDLQATPQIDGTGDENAIK